MIKMSLKLRKDGTAVYKIATAYRLLFLFFSLFLLVGFFYQLGSFTFNIFIIVPIFLFLLGLLGAGYIEKWTFRANEGFVDYQYGWFFIVKNETIAASDIKQFELTYFLRGFSTNQVPFRRAAKGNRKMVVFSIRLNNQRKKDIEIIGSRSSSGYTEKSAQLIAQLMGKPLFEDEELNLNYS